MLSHVTLELLKYLSRLSELLRWLHDTSPHIVLLFFLSFCVDHYEFVRSARRYLRQKLSGLTDSFFDLILVHLSQLLA